ncbi:M15 family metallopeptidase [Paracoccus aminovorans]|uniref:M15 family metallopeptidase n=1 Tax=Paracoccus aminovorans TaxID=34004 RepID=UPI002B25E268|nr:M15 family metallopeptidase [Paracoccus aminovorans]
MKPGQVMTRWWQDLVAGRLRTPQAIFRAAISENPDPAQAGDRVFDLPEDGPTFDAPERLKAPGFLRSPSYTVQLERADWNHCDPRLMYWAARFVDAAKKRGIPLYVHCALRGEAEQKRVYAAGNSRARYPSSAHNIGEAVDIVHGVFHRQMTRDEWRYLHVLGQLVLDRVNAELPKAQKLNLTWGGNFRSLYDPAHWEVSDYRNRLRPIPDGPPKHYLPQFIFRQWRLNRPS